MKNKGFSFVELLVAVAILGIISLPIVSSFALAAKTDAKAYHLSAMNDAADDVMMLLEEMRISALDPEVENKLPALQTAFFESFEGYQLADLEFSTTFQDDVLTFNYHQYRFELTLKDLDEKYYRVDFKIFYTSNGTTLEVNRKGLLKYA